MPPRSTELGARRIERQASIVADARRIFGERGSTDVPMEELALLTGVARSTLYLYFPSREALVLACLHSMYEQVRRSITEREVHGDSATTQLRELITRLFEAIDEDPRFFRVALAAESQRSGLGRAVEAEFAVIGLEVGGDLVEMIRAGQHNGTFASGDPVILGALVGQQLYGALAVRAADPAPPRAAEAAETVATFVLRALR